MELTIDRGAWFVSTDQDTEMGSRREGRFSARGVSPTGKVETSDARDLRSDFSFAHTADSMPGSPPPLGLLGTEDAGIFDDTLINDVARAARRRLVRLAILEAILLALFFALARPEAARAGCVEASTDAFDRTGNLGSVDYSQTVSDLAHQSYSGRLKFSRLF
jgi:hypothetical protein